MIPATPPLVPVVLPGKVSSGVVLTEERIRSRSPGSRQPSPSDWSARGGGCIVPAE